MTNRQRHEEEQSSDVRTMAKEIQSLKEQIRNIQENFALMQQTQQNQNKKFENLAKVFSQEQRNELVKLQKGQETERRRNQNDIAGTSLNIELLEKIAKI